MITKISIHALREESDYQAVAVMCVSGSFQSTLSVRRATWRSAVFDRFECISIHALREESDAGDLVTAQWILISIHALREESDLCPIRDMDIRIHFNPRSP